MQPTIQQAEQVQQTMELRTQEFQFFLVGLFLQFKEMSVDLHFTLLDRMEFSGFTITQPEESSVEEEAAAVEVDRQIKKATGETAAPSLKHWSIVFRSGKGMS